MVNCVYIIHSSLLNRYYIGEALDVEKRIDEHNTGFYKNAFTTIANDWKLFLKIACRDRVLARKIEAHIKKMKSKTFIENLIRHPEIIAKLKEKY